MISSINSSIKFDPPVIAHRGASYYAPENTMSAFVKAAQLGLKWVEFDVTLSADDVPIIFHDEKLDRTSDGHGNIMQHPYAYLRTLDAGKWFDTAFSGERIPSLAQVLEFLLTAKMNANIEIKTSKSHEKKLVEAIVNVAQPYLLKSTNQFIFSSFSKSALQLLRNISKIYQIGLLLHEWDEAWREHCLNLDCVSVHVNHEIITTDRAYEIKNMQKLLLCYTVNKPTRAHELYAMGVDAVFSDVPDKIAKTLKFR